MAISSYVNNEITSSTDTFNVWLTRTNSIITDMGSVVVSVGDNNVGDVTVTGALGANTVFAGTELRGGDANTSANLTITSAAEFDSDVTISGEVLLNGASANLTITNLNTIVNSNTTIFNDYVEFESDMILPVGTTLQRGADETGNFRFNTSTGRFEGYTGATWELKADTALALTSARTIALSGDLTGSASFNGASDITIATTIQNTAQTQETIADIVGTMVSNNTESGITVTYQDDDNTLDFAVVPGSVDHDSLLNFVANEHIDHSAVTITAGSGLSGGGDITASRTLSVNEGAVDHDSLLNFVSNEHIDHSSVSIIAGSGLSGGGNITTSRTLSVNEGAVDHDSLLNFVSNEHIDHSSVSVIAGSGLSGGGDITTSRTVNVGAGNGITVNANDVAVNAQHGLVANSSGTFVVAGDGLVANSSGTFVVAGDGLVANSSGVHVDPNANVSFDTIDTNNLYVDSLYANGATGSAGEFLATNGTTVYWASVSEFTGESDTLDSVTGRGATTTNDITVGGLTISNNQPTFTLNGDVTGSATFDGSNTTITTTINGSDITVGALTVDSISANGSIGTTGQVLTSNGTEAYWSSLSGLDNQIKDLVGEMFSGNSESGISVVYQTSDNTVDFNVDDFTITLGGDLSGSTTITNLGNATLNATVTGGTADSLSEERTITLSGEVSGSTSFDGSSDVTITTNLETVNGFTSTGNIVLSNADLDGFVTATFASQFSITATSGAITVNWNEGQNQIQAEPTGSITYTFTDPAGPGHFQLIINSDGTSTAQAITFPASVKWMGTPYTGVDDKAAIINFYYDGSSTYYAIASYEN